MMSSTRLRCSTSSVIAGSSPEVLVRLRDGTVTIRPLAGTRPRGATPPLDKKLEEVLKPVELDDVLSLGDRGAQILDVRDPNDAEMVGWLERRSDYAVEERTAAA